MEISSLPEAINISATRTDISVAVLARNLDTIEKLGQSMIKMMEQSVAPHLGQNIDIRV